MTRAEFASELAKYWMRCCGMIEGESFSVFVERTKNDWIDPAYPLLIAAVATNGFDPEPGAPTVVLTGQAANAYAQNALEQSQESAKRSRPFVGSHKLPVDLDWD